MTFFRNRYRVESTRLAGWDYAARGWYFVTICTKDKKYTLGTVSGEKVVLSRAGTIAADHMQHMADHYSNVMVDRFVIMPNHLHAIIVIEGSDVYSPAGDGASPASTGICGASLGDTVGGYKAGVSRMCHREGIADFAWQARFHEHSLQSNASVNAVRDYIERNPRNWLEDPDIPGRLTPRETGLAPSLQDCVVK